MSWWWRRGKPALETAEHLHFINLVLEALGLRTWLISTGGGILMLFVAAADPKNWSVTEVLLYALTAGAVVMVITVAVTVLYRFLNSPIFSGSRPAVVEQQLEQTRAVLTINGPHVFRDPHYKNYVRWRMKVHNAGPAAASNVQMKLRSGKSEPKDPSWTRDYPYPINRVGRTLDEVCQINPNDDEDYDIVLGFKPEGGEQFFATIDTKSHGHSQIQIQPDERWEFSYEVTATNSPAVRFTLQFFLYYNELTVVGMP